MLRRLPLLILVLPVAATGLAGCRTQPDAILTVSPNSVLPGQTITADATGSTNVLRKAEYSWDLDGDGTLERRSGPIEHTSFTAPGQFGVTVMITNKSETFGGSMDAGSDATTQTVTVRDPHVPSPSFTISPNPACSSGSVRFNASDSTDPDGSIVRYQWDLDGNGTLETDTRTNPTVTRVGYGTTPAQRTMRLRVTDNDGRIAETNRVLVIDDSICQPAPAAAVSAAAVEHKARFRLSMGMRQTKRGATVMSGKRLMISGFVGRGRAALSGLPPPLARVRNARWVARLSAILDTRTKRMRVQGEALVDLGGRGHLCTSLAIDRRKGRKATGRMKVLGGSGAARHIDGQAAYTGDAGLSGPLMVRGRIEMERRAKGKGLTRACKALLPKRSR